MSKIIERKLRILVEWLKEETVYVDSYTDGALERAVKYGQEETYRRIGDIIEEILDMDDEQLENER